MGIDKFIADNISWIGPSTMAGTAWIVKQLFNKAIREGIHKIHERVDKVVIEINKKIDDNDKENDRRCDELEKRVTELEIHRDNDTKRAEKFEQQILDTLKDMREDIRTILKKGE